MKKLESNKWLDNIEESLKKSDFYNETLDLFEKRLEDYETRAQPIFFARISELKSLVLQTRFQKKEYFKNFSFKTIDRN